MPRSRQFDHLQAKTLATLRAAIPDGVPGLVVERRPAPVYGFQVTRDGVILCVGRAECVRAFLDGFTAGWTGVRP